MHLLGFSTRLDRPCSLDRPLTIRTRLADVHRMEGAMLGDAEVGLTDDDGAVGRATVKVQAVDHATYQALRRRPSPGETQEHGAR
jgi:hypothetical protein